MNLFCFYQLSFNRIYFVSDAFLVLLHILSMESLVLTFEFDDLLFIFFDLVQLVFIIIHDLFNNKYYDYLFIDMLGIINLPLDNEESLSNSHLVLIDTMNDILVLFINLDLII